MPTYINLINWTDQGIRNVKESPSRLDAARAAAREAGGDIKDTYMTMGTYDVVAITEFPNDEAAAIFALRAGALGNIRTTTLKAFPEAETRKIIGALP